MFSNKMKLVRLFAVALGLWLCAASAPVSAAARFLVACTTACTWDNSSTLIWSTTTGGAPGSAAPTSADAVTLDANSCVGGVTCTITVNATISVQSITMGACTASTTGCILDFSANNNNVNLSVAFSGTGTGTRTLNMGNGTWTMSAGSGTVWNMTTATNLTFNANSSTLVFSNISGVGIRFLEMNAALTYATVTLGSNTGGGPINLQTSFAAATLNLTGPCYILFHNSATTTVTTLNNVSGTAFNTLVSLLSDSNGTTATISSSTSKAFAWATFRDITFTGAGTFTATNSIDLGHNSGVTITAPASGGGGFVGLIGG